MKRSLARAIAYPLAMLATANFAGAIAIGVFYGPSSETRLGDLSFAFSLLLLAWVGAVIVRRQPDNRVGLLALIGGFAGVVQPLSREWAQHALSDPAMPGGDLAAWLTAWTWFPAVVALPMLILIFPDGRPLSGWRWAWRGAIALAVIGVVAGSVPTWGMPNEVLIDPKADAPEFFVLAYVVAPIVALGLIPLALVSLVVRYRRGGTLERHQIKWLGWAMGISLALLMAANLSPAADEAIGVLSTMALVLVPIAIAVAILKHRLYDIDVVISRTLVFGVLAVFITGVYVGVVVGLGSLVGGGGEPNLGLSILATGLVAVLFEPVRLRAQSWANRVVFGRRASPYQVLSGLTARLGETTSDESLLERLTTSLGEGTGSEAMVWLRIGEGFRPAATSSGVLTDERVDPEGSDLVVPVVHEEETLGLLTLTAPRGQQISPADERLVGDVAGNVGLMLRNVRLNTELAARAEELAASRRRLVAVQDEERRRLERDLHDGAQQHVVAAAMQLNMAKMVAEREGHDQVAAQLGDLVELDQQAVEQLRTIARGIYPPLLEAEGLEAAISGAARSLPISVSVEADQLPRYPQDIEAAVYFCVTETIRDALRRDATTVGISLTPHPDSLEAIIIDNGTSTSSDQPLAQLTDRVTATGGTLTTTPTGIHITLPASQLAEVAP